MDPVVAPRRVRAACILLTALMPLAGAPASAATERGRFDRPPFHHGRLPAGTAPVAHVSVGFRDEAGSLDPTP